MQLSEAREELAAAQEALAKLKAEAQTNNAYLQEIEGACIWSIISLPSFSLVNHFELLLLDGIRFAFFWLKPCEIIQRTGIYLDAGFLCRTAQ